MATKKMALIATKGTLDMAYPPFILASTAAALGLDVQIFFTFYGLQLLSNLQASASLLQHVDGAVQVPTGFAKAFDDGGMRSMNMRLRHAPSYPPGGVMIAT